MELREKTNSNDVLILLLLLLCQYWFFFFFLNCRAYVFCMDRAQKLKLEKNPQNKYPFEMSKHAKKIKFVQKW